MQEDPGSQSTRAIMIVTLNELPQKRAGKSTWKQDVRSKFQLPIFPNHLSLWDSACHWDRCRLNSWIAPGCWSIVLGKSDERLEQTPNPWTLWCKNLRSKRLDADRYPWNHGFFQLRECPTAPLFPPPSSVASAPRLHVPGSAEPGYDYKFQYTTYTCVCVYSVVYIYIVYI